MCSIRVIRSNRLYPLPLSVFDTGTLTNAYQLVTITPFSEPCNLIRIVNTSDVAVMISYDGVTDHDVIRKDKTVAISAQLNKRPAWPHTKFVRGTKVYVKYILGASKRGHLRVIGYYQ